jgi:HSP90 family molecular chaperone
MVAKKVDVITKKAGESQAYMFSTDGAGEFEIKPVTKEEHGTVVYIKLKNEAKEFLSRWRVKEIIKKYSNHIAYPIMIHYTEEESEGEGDKKVTKKVKKSEQANEATALWILPKASLKKDDYIEFYKTLSHGDNEPLTYLHNKVEGKNEFITLFYIPKTVFSGLVTACLLAVWPTSLSPLSVKAIIEGVVLLPSALAITTGSPPSITATHELVVPRSIPIVFPISIAS